MKTLGTRLPLVAMLAFGFADLGGAQTADFTFMPWGPTDNSVVAFTPNPPNGLECDWDWGDGTPVTMDAPCVFREHVYPLAGVYIVTLNIVNVGSVTKAVGIMVDNNAQNDLVPKFHASKTTPDVGEDVDFIDQTTPQASTGHWTWDFGDGTVTYIPSPTHQWSTPGDKTVTLLVQNQQTSRQGRTFSQVIHVAGTGVTPTATHTPVQSATPSHTPTPVQGQQVLVGYVPVVGSTPGAFGSFFKAAVQLVNPGTSATSGRFVYHPAGKIGAPTDPSLSWSLTPGQTLSYDDVVAAMSQTGLGSLDVYVTKGTPIPIIVTRVFDDNGVNGTSGFTEPFILAADVPASGSGYLLGPSDTARFRYNIGIRSLGSSVSVTATVRSSTGAVLHTVTNSYDPNVFVQTKASDFLGFSLGDDQSIQISYTGGGVIVYGATVDNVTNDPSAQFLSTAALLNANAAPRPRDSSGTALLFAAVLALLGTGIGAVVIRR